MLIGCRLSTNINAWHIPIAVYNSTMSHPSCVYINNRRRYQSITQHYLKRCLIKDDNNYMFRPIAVIIRFSSESMLVVLYRIGTVMSRWWDLNICDVWYMLLLRDTWGWVVSVMCAILGYTAKVCLLAAVLCGSPASRHTWTVPPRITHIIVTPPPPRVP
jgi:hypothetical protein